MKRNYAPFIDLPKPQLWRIATVWDEAYYDAARHLVAGVCDGNLHRDSHGVAGVFLFRHYVELALKYLLFYSRWLEADSAGATEIRKIEFGHDLASFWKQVKAEVPAKLGDQAVWQGFDTDFIESLVNELHKVDPGSFAFRYNPGGKFGVEPKTEASDTGEVEPNEAKINFELLLDQMQHSYNALDSIKTRLIQMGDLKRSWAIQRVVVKRLTPEAEFDSWTNKLFIDRLRSFPAAQSHGMRRHERYQRRGRGQVCDCSSRDRFCRWTLPG